MPLLFLINKLTMSKNHGIFFFMFTLTSISIESYIDMGIVANVGERGFECAET